MKRKEDPTASEATSTTSTDVCREERFLLNRLFQDEKRSLLEHLFEDEKEIIFVPHVLSK